MTFTMLLAVIAFAFAMSNATFQTIIWATFVVLLVLYILKRRSRKAKQRMM